MPTTHAEASQVVTYRPSSPPWSIACTGNAGAGFPGSLTIASGSVPLIRLGDKFQLWTGASLKEPTVFTVTSIGADFLGNTGIAFTPDPQVAVTASDTAKSVPALLAPRLLSQVGHVQGLKWSFVLPGGCDQMSCTVQRDVRYRPDAFNAGRFVRVMRGASIAWEGKLQEPAPGRDGWAITAKGAGQYGADFDATYTGTWGTGIPDIAVGAAIGRGLRWINPGIGNPAGMWTGQAVDSGSQKIDALLNLITTKGNLTWYVTTTAQGNVLEVFPLPDQKTPTRLLVSNDPAARTLGGDYNRLFLRYQSSADSASAATYATTSVSNPDSIRQHGPMEEYVDISSAGQYTAALAQGVGNNILGQYIRANFATAFTVQPGQLLNAGGQPVDLGCEQAGTVVRLMLMDFGYGGELRSGPVTFLTGAYEYDDEAQVATVTPFQSVRTNFSSLLSATSQTLPTR